MIAGTGAVILLSLMCCLFIFCTLRLPSLMYSLFKLYMKLVLIMIVTYAVLYGIFIKIPQYFLNR